MQLGVVQVRCGGAGRGAAGELIEADPEDVGDLDHSVQARSGETTLPAVVDAGTDVEELSETSLAQPSGSSEVLESLDKIFHGELELRVTIEAHLYHLLSDVMDDMDNIVYIM